MSVKVMSLVWDSPAFAGNSKLVMLCLADYANDEGLCWPSIGSIERKCSVSRSTVKAQLKKLENEGFLSIQRRRKEDGDNENNLYYINVDKVKFSVEQGGENNPRSKSDLGQNSDTPRAKSNPPLGQNSTDPRSKSDPKPSLDPSLQPSKDPSGSKTRKRKTRMPAGFHVSAAMREWYAQQAGFTLNVDDATNVWCDAMLAKDYQYVDWESAWRNGMRNANKWEMQNNSKQPRPRNVNDIATRDADFGPPEGY